MAQEDSTSLATKQDIQLILGRIQSMEGGIRQEMQVMGKNMQDQFAFVAESINNMATKEELNLVKQELQEEIQTSEKHILAAVEHQRYDDRGITNDRFTEHHQRIRALEVKTGLAV